MKRAFIFYFAALVGLTLFSYGFVDANFPTSLLPMMSQWVVHYKILATISYVVLMSIYFVMYICY